MITKKHSTRARIGAIIGTMVGLTVITLLFNLAWPVLVTQAGPTLPLPVSPPPGNPADDDDDSSGRRDDTPLTAAIQLTVQGGSAGMWGVVQWQGSDGRWHDVGGWRSLISGSGQRWVVESKDFNTGPFRWVVRQSETGPQLGASAPFQMPVGANETVSVLVSVQ